MSSEANKPLQFSQQFQRLLVLWPCRAGVRWKNGFSLVWPSFKQGFLPCSSMDDSEEHKTGSGAGSVKKCHPVVPGPVATFLVLPTPPHCILIDTFLACFYSKALPANTLKHIPLLCFQSPLTIPFTANPVQHKAAGGLWICLSWDRVLPKWESNIFWRAVIISSGTDPTEEEAALWSWTIQTKTACSHITKCQHFLLLL